MDVAPRADSGSRASAWWRAARPLAHANIAPAILFGQALAWALTGTFDVRAAVAVHVFGVVDHLFIVFANDVADRETDARNRTHNLYSGGSRVLAEGRISEGALREAALAMGALVVGVSVAFALAFARPAMIGLGLAAVALLHAYSFRPLRLSYRGGGELLQGLGVGVVLPLAGFVAQSPSLEAARVPWGALVPTFLLAAAGNVTTALPDAPSDRESDKRTWPVRRGERAARRDSLIVIAIAISMIPFVTPALGGIALAAITAPPLLLVLVNARAVRDADAERHAACFRFVTLSGGAIGYVLAAWSVALFMSGR